MSAGTGVNPYEAMSEADKAEEMSESMVYLGIDFEAAVEDLRGAVSSHVAAGLDDYEVATFEHIQAVARNGIALAVNVQGADIEILDTDHENSESYQEGLEALDIRINDVS
ncbi:hypothetical protein A6A08_05125 [Nocardiopsis sp. TSRI0078]|uniref:hypothetical protein n=1 Tax=unclassified Nocardiopsis TaxID=2649073 RepID=UPI000939F9AA|nr:hypothetical protein [Nocardiopsis sp. TSRI0078]OKI18990.1 hypothetical protein A6A08_05125 [Nocardiopsis sp. TSRI0078]